MPGWSYLTVHVPAVDDTVNVAPTCVQAPLLENVTGFAEPPPVAPTVKCVPTSAAAGACGVTVIVWSTFCAVTVSVTCGAAL